ERKLKEKKKKKARREREWDGESKRHSGEVKKMKHRVTKDERRLKMREEESPEQGT
ncbi:hypothetical protein GBF38_008540, partial [Nibea albiflora]